MRNINYVYVDPGGNQTILVLDKISRKSQPSVANKIMRIFKLPCEQVGFLEAPENSKATLRLQMMGGEFCGNALRATAAFLARSPSRKRSFILETSGTNKLIRTSVKITKSSVWAETEIPAAKAKLTKLKQYGMIRVNLEGITHFLVYKKYFNRRARILYWLRSLKITAAAYGLVFYEQVAKKSFSIVPVVCVRKTNTLVYETSCASASVALAIAKKKNLKVTQPSGYSLEAAVSEGKASIGGLIKCIKQGQMNI